MDTTKYKIGDMWKVSGYFTKSDTVWFVKFPKGIMHFRTKKTAKLWADSLKTKGY